MTQLFLPYGKLVSRVLTKDAGKNDPAWDYRLIDLMVTNVTPQEGRRIPLDAKPLVEVLLGDHGSDIKRTAIQALYASGYTVTRVNEILADAVEARRRANERFQRFKESVYGQHHH